MSIRRENWLRNYFCDGDLPAWPCPTCGQGLLGIAEGQNGRLLFTLLTRECVRRSGNPDYYFQEDEGTFSAVLKCSRSACGEYISVCGQRFTGIDYSETNEEQPVAEYHPKYFFPTVPLFALPAKCPETISTEIKSAFAVYWCDTASCLNRIRCSIEMLLTKIGVIRYVQTGKKRKNLSLNERINRIPAKYASFADSLHALRWLGNAGSHADKVTKEDALDGFELLQHILEEMFEPRHKRIAAISSGINRKKGPRRPKKT